LIKIIREINPKKLFPVHTEHPEMFKEFFDNVDVVEKGREYEI